MQQSAVIEWLDYQIATVLADTSLLSLSTPTEHVGLAQRRDTQIYPFVGIRTISAQPLEGGLANGELFVDTLTKDGNGVVQSITYRRESRLRLEVDPVTDGNPKLRDELVAALVDHFTLLERRDNTPDDITLSVAEASPQDRADEFVRLSGLTLVIEYERFITDDGPVVADEVNLDVDVGDSDDTVSESEDADAFDELIQ